MTANRYDEDEAVSISEMESKLISDLEKKMDSPFGWDEGRTPQGWISSNKLSVLLFMRAMCA